MEKLVLSGEKTVLYCHKTNTLKFLFLSERYFGFPADPVKYVIKIWQQNPGFHIAYDQNSKLFYRLQMVCRHRAPGHPIRGPDGYPVYNLRVFTKYPYKKPEQENEAYISENPIFYYEEWYTFCTWMESLDLADCKEDQFCHLFDYLSLYSTDDRSINIGA